MKKFLFVLSIILLLSCSENILSPGEKSSEKIQQAISDNHVDVIDIYLSGNQKVFSEKHFSFWGEFLICNDIYYNLSNLSYFSVKKNYDGYYGKMTLSFL